MSAVTRRSPNPPESSMEPHVMNEPTVNLDLALDHGLSESEFEKIGEILGRQPTYTELGIFSAMWSEHCSYKSSKFHLKRLPTKGPQVVIGPGENAGAVDLGDGLCAVFKMESHNHPSFIEPYQGAATGVGGILRDVFTMGARPVANLNALRFGSPHSDHMKYLVAGVTKGIGDYGNCIGVPTVGGEVTFDSAYQGNILVNAMTVGLAHRSGIFLGEASGPGNAVVYVGAKTGRDGIHGATMASEEFNEEAEQKRPTVQVGDPFTEKLLLEALMELFPTGSIIGIQDMGAAGLTSSAFEMADRAGSGVDLDLACVPTRETGMTAYEIMLSESQERMLLVCRPERFPEIEKVFEKWDLSAAIIGTVADSGRVRIKSPEGKLVVDVPVAPLADNAPIYERPWEEPAHFQTNKSFDTAPYGNIAKDQAGPMLHRLLSAPNIAARTWFYRQYDQTVQTNTVKGPDQAEAALIRIKGTDKAIAVTTDCNPRFVKLDPFLGTAHAVAEAARNISCTGGLPLAITDCMNFGSPEAPAVMWQFKRAVDGMIEACNALNTPVVSGNVSFYNETNNKPVLPTPAVGMVGLLKNRTHHATNRFSQNGHQVFLLGQSQEELGGSEYLDFIHGHQTGAVPQLNLAKEARLQAFLREAIAAGTLLHSRDCSLGGLAVTLAKCCFGSPAVGGSFHLDEDISKAAQLFGESASRVVAAVRAEDGEAFSEQAGQSGVSCHLLGVTGGTHLTISVKGVRLIHEPVSELKQSWQNALDHLLS